MNPKEIFEKNKELSTMDPVFNHIFDVAFPISLGQKDTETLSLMLKSIDQTSMQFQLLVDENKRIVPLKEIVSMCKTENEDLRVMLCRQDGEIILSTIYHKCKFTANIDEMFVLDSASAGTKDLHVYFTFASKSIYDESNTKIA